MNIILQHYTGRPGKLEEMSMENISRYADMVGAEYKFIEGQVFREHMPSQSQKVFMLDESFDEYDTVLMLDIDKFVRKGEIANVFDVPGIGLYESIQQGLHRRLASRYPLASMDYPYWGGAIYKMDLKTRQHLRAGLSGTESFLSGPAEPYPFHDEGIMHILAAKTKFNSDHNYLPRKWCYCSYLPNLEESGFIHIRTKITPTGPKRTKMENLMAIIDRGLIEV